MVRIPYIPSNALTWICMCFLAAQPIVICAQSEALFTNASALANVDESGLHHAAAVADFDGDGWEDIYVATKQGINRLFRNTGGMHFEEVAEAADRKSVV